MPNPLTIKNPDAVRAIIRERAKFIVRLINYDQNLVRPPSKANDFLPRYHRVCLEVQKKEPAQLADLTIRVFRLGSKIGEDNVEYVSIPVSDLPVGTFVKQEVYLFDPFNLPFDSMRVEYSPEINLSSKMCVKYKEIKDMI